MEIGCCNYKLYSNRIVSMHESQISQMNVHNAQIYLDLKGLKNIISNCCTGTAYVTVRQFVTLSSSCQAKMWQAG